ncbi:uncharacterized protein LOC144660038 isoform X2 [Oculina patagonica]
MKNLAIAILVFCTFICAAYSFKCYQCENDDHGVNYTLAQCEKDLTKVNCSANGNFTCFRFHYTTHRDDIKEARGCMEKHFCEEFVNDCKRGNETCEVAACCVSDGDTPCNSDLIASTTSSFTASTTSSFTVSPSNRGFTVSISLMMIMFAVLCTLKIF